MTLILYVWRPSWMKRLHMCDQIICEDSFFNNSCQDTDTGSKEKYEDKQE